MKMKFDLRNLFYVQMTWLGLLLGGSLSDDSKMDPGITKEICMLESFQPQCLKNEVILMNAATYGRMRIGRCITSKEIHAIGPHFGEDPRYLGCSADVLSVLDHKCSGKTECNIRLSDIPDDNVQPCFPGLKMYLEISYHCVTIVDEERSCAVIVAKTPTSIIIAKDVTQRRCGTKPQPWTLEAPVGQKIAIRLIDFSTYSDQRSGQSCLNSGVMVDMEGKKNASICVGGNEREKEIFLSTGKAVEIFLTPSDQKHVRDEIRFLLEVKAVGCSDVVPPEDTWLKRKDDAIVIGCYSSRQTWHLRCETGKWIGVLGNCSQDASLHESATAMEYKNTISSKGQVLAIVAIGGFTLAICLTIACVGTVYLRKFYVSSKKKEDYRTRNYTIIPARGGTAISDIPLGATTKPSSGNDADRFSTQQQIPTYSLYAGDNQMHDVNNSLSSDNTNIRA